MARHGSYRPGPPRSLAAFVVARSTFASVFQAIHRLMPRRSRINQMPASNPDQTGRANMIQGRLCWGKAGRRLDSNANNENTVMSTAIAKLKREHPTPGLRTRSNPGISSHARGLNSHRFSLAHAARCAVANHNTSISAPDNPASEAYKVPTTVNHHRSI